MLEELDASAVKWGYTISTWTFLRKFEAFMSRKSKSNGSVTNNGSNSSSGTRGDVKWQWANCRLSDEDIAELEQSADDLDYLATCLIALGDDGYGVSIKTLDEGKSKCVIINRPNYPSNGRTVGVSAFGGNLRDAIVTVLYKLDHYGGGDFTGFDLEAEAESARPRFR